MADAMKLREPITHEVKCWREPFAAVKSGAKPWELRLNDRDYRVGDTLRQFEWDKDACRYVGGVVEHEITWALYGPAFGLPYGYVIMSLAASPPAPARGGVDWTEQRRLLQAKIDQWAGSDYLGDDRLEVDDAIDLADAIQALLASPPAREEAPYGASHQPWLQPGDQPDRAFILRFDDADRGEMSWMGEGAEAEALKAWNLFAPTWNCWLFSTHPREKDPAEGAGEEDWKTCPICLETVAPDSRSAIDDLVDRFSTALRDKLHAAEAKYGHDDAWTRDDWQSDLVRDLQRHVDKGDPRDVAAYCAFAWHHGWPTALRNRTSEPEAGAVSWFGDGQYEPTEAMIEAGLETCRPGNHANMIASFKSMMQQAYIDGLFTHPAPATAHKLKEIAQGLDVAMSWVDYPFIENNTPEDEIRQRLGFMQKDAEPHRQALASLNEQPQ